MYYFEKFSVTLATLEGTRGTDMRMIIAALVIAFGVSGGVKAGRFDGNTLQEWCTSSDRWGMGACRGYIAGARDMLLDWKNNITENWSVVCEPEGVTAGQAAAVVIKWLNEHPEKRHEGAQMLVFMALNEAFPCK
jgi:hypothetical protein